MLQRKFNYRVIHIHQNNTYNIWLFFGRFWRRFRLHLGPGRCQACRQAGSQSGKRSSSFPQLSSRSKQTLYGRQRLCLSLGNLSFKINHLLNSNKYTFSLFIFVSVYIHSKKCTTNKAHRTTQMVLKGYLVYWLFECLVDLKCICLCVGSFLYLSIFYFY